MASSNRNTFRVTGPLFGEFPGHRTALTFLVHLRLNNPMSKQSKRRVNALRCLCPQGIKIEADWSAMISRQPFWLIYHRKCMELIKHRNVFESALRRFNITVTTVLFVLVRYLIDKPCFVIFNVFNTLFIQKWYNIHDKHHIIHTHYSTWIRCFTINVLLGFYPCISRRFDPFLQTREKIKIRIMSTLWGAPPVFMSWRHRISEDIHIYDTLYIYIYIYIYDRW